MRPLPLVAVLLCGIAALNPAQTVSSSAPAATSSTSATTPAPATTHIQLGRLTGHVLCDDTRRPARGALVLATALPSDTPSGQSPQLGGVAMTHVRNDGSYTIQHIAPGEYTVFAILPGYLSPFDDLLGADVQRGDPAHQRELLARNGTVVVRADASATFDLTLQRGAAISGRVLYSDGVPASSVSLLLEDAKAQQPPSDHNEEQQELARAMAARMFGHQNLNTDDQGRFRLVGLRPGTYRLAAAQPTSSSLDGTTDGEATESLGLLFGMRSTHALRFYAGDTTHRASAKTYELRPGEEVTGVEITLPVDAFHDVRGTVAAKDGRTINMGQLTLTDSSDPQLAFRAGIDRDGSFLLTQVPPGTYTLTASNARIGENADTTPGLPERFQALKPIAAFADGSVTVLIKDGDLDGVSLTLTEVPLPKSEAADPAPGANADPND